MSSAMLMIIPPFSATLPASPNATEALQVEAATLTRDKASPAIPLGDPGGWIRSSDYPSTAVSDESEGRVSVVLKVDPQGRVASCTVTVSSGIATLDDTACNLMVLRAVFSPATDAKGKPTWGSYRTSVVWKMNDPLPVPEAKSATTSFIINTDGTTSECHMEAKGLTPDEIEQSLKFCRNAAYLPATDAYGEPIALRVRFTNKLEVEPLTGK